MGKSKSHNNLEVVSKKKNPAHPSGIFLCHDQFSVSKQLQLLAWRVNRLGLAVAENLHVAKLLVGDAQDAHLAIFRHERLHALDVDFGVFTAWTMPQVDGKLEHRKAVGHNALAEVGSGLAFLLRVRRQVEKHQHPHDSVFAKTVHVKAPLRDTPPSAIRR